MEALYPAIYRDRHGEEETVIRNDGRTLTMTVRGVEFSGRMFDDFETERERSDPALASFTLHYHPAHPSELCDCEIEYEATQPVVVDGAIVAAPLHVKIELGQMAERGGLTHENFIVTLRLNGATYQSRGKSGWFEDELLEIQRALPDGTYLKNCFNCAYSDYSIYGHGAFGSMLRLRGRKAQYLKARNKREYMAVMDDFTEIVQETYLCPEFERRIPGTGYRG